QVDIKLGMDRTNLAYEKQVEVIVLVAGDSDFVPAAKLARTKGIDFILDPLRHDINPDLSEHIDGIQSYNLTSALSHVWGVAPDPKPTWWDEMMEKRKKKQSKKRNKKNR
ncbi:MAG: NYN domain-containing protein, partial [Gilliamella sp.]|nr:NYN domain-containing protein [Gilliamella sp.]